MKLDNTIIIECPIFSRSGYGEHTRYFVDDIATFFKNVVVVPIIWGRIGKINEYSNPAVRIAETVEFVPDVYIYVGMPDGFSRKGKLNIGVTAGIETDVVPSSWLEHFNRMDMIIVSSEHSRQAILKRGMPSSKIMVLHERISARSFDMDFDFLTNDFYFLCIGEWLQGSLGNDRKNIPWTISCFIEAFKNTDNMPGLVLKTDHIGYSVAERAKIKNIIDSLIVNYKNAGHTVPEIILLHGKLSPDEMAGLLDHDKIKSYVSLTHGEGFGRPAAEFMAKGKPILISNWSSVTEFVKPGANYLIKGEVKPVDNSVINKYIVQESNWFYPDYSDTLAGFQDIYNNYDNYLKNSHINIREYDRLSGEYLVVRLKNIITNALKYK